MSADEITNQTYDRIAADFADRFWHVILERPLNTFAAAVDKTQPVLDLGCGPGRDIELLRQHGLTVIGADRSAGMLKEAQQRVGGALVQADMRYLPMRAASFGGIWMCASLLHIPRAEVPGVLAEAQRILRAKGVLYISVQQGTGERWSDSDGGQRFFTLFQPDELLDRLTQMRFSIQEHWIESGGHSNWIQIIAVNTPP